jgi:hypothetical protein
MYLFPQTERCPWIVFFYVIGLSFQLISFPPPKRFLLLNSNYYLFQISNFEDVRGEREEAKANRHLEYRSSEKQSI